MTRRASGMIIAGALLVAACAGAAPPTAPATASSPSAPTASPTGPRTDTPLGPTTPAATPPPGATTPPTATEPWQMAALVDVRSGQTLRVADLAGKLVVIEPMAIWCTNCRAQQNELRSALATIGRPQDIVAVSLDVDPFEQSADLAAYADQRDYPWHFAIAGPDLSRILAMRFGDQVLSPPSTPKILVAPDGSVQVSFGHQSAEELVSHLNALLP